MKNSVYNSKPSEAYTKEAIETIQLVSYRKDEHAEFVGSYSYRAQKYPGDIDGINPVNTYKEHGKWVVANDFTKLAKAVTRRMQEIVAEIHKTENTYFVELKAGYDYPVLTFFRPIGNMDNGTFTVDPNLISKTLDYEKKFPESKKLMQLVRETIQKGGDKTYDLVNAILRNYYILRWTAKDIMNGYIISPSKSKITLFEALIKPAFNKFLPLVKMDIIKLVDGKYMEVSNIYLLDILRKGETIPMSAYPAAGGITLDVEKYAFSPVYYSLFKCIKRMYAYGRFLFLFESCTEYEPFLKKALTFLSSDISIVYQTKSEIDTIITMYEKNFVKVTNENVNEILDESKNKLSNVLSFNEGQLSKLYEIIKTIQEEINATKKIKYLKIFSETLNNVIQKTSINWLNYHDYNPIPALFLPTVNFIKEMNAKNQQHDPLLVTQNQHTYNWLKNQG